MELKRYIRIVFRWWWVVICGAVVVSIASFAFSYSQTPVYRTSVTLIVSPKSAINELSDVQQSLDTLDKPTIINTYAEIVQSRKVYSEAAESLGIQTTSTDPTDQVVIFASVLQKTNMIRIDVEGANPQLVQNMADRVTDLSIAYINDLYELYDIRVLDAAEYPMEPVSPNIPRDVALGAVLGVILGVSLSFLAEYLRAPQEKIESATIVDVETGLYNKRYFLQRVREEIGRSSRSKRPVVVCLISLSDLGDTVQLYSPKIRQALRLKVFAFLKREIRQGEILARWGSNGYAAWLMLDTTEEAAKLAIERLRGRLESTVIEEENDIRLNFVGAFGAAVYTVGTSETDLLNSAEQALHQAESKGPGGVVVVTGQPLNTTVQVFDNKPVR